MEFAFSKQGRNALFLPSFTPTTSISVHIPCEESRKPYPSKGNPQEVDFYHGVNLVFDVKAPLYPLLNLI